MFCAYARPRYQVSVDRTIGLLIYVFLVYYAIQVYNNIEREPHGRLAIRLHMKQKYIKR